MNLKTLFILMSLLLTTASEAGITTKEIDSKQVDTTMKGMVAYDNAIHGKRTGVLIVHEWCGHNEHARDKARMLAKRGYVAFALDMYGDRQTANHPEDAEEFASAVGGNLPLAKLRFEAVMDTLKKQSNVEAEKLASMGYWVGGGIVPNMARMGVELEGVSSFHSSIATKSPAKKGDIKTRIRVFNGAADPFVKAEQIAALKNKMKNAGIDFKFVNYPGVKHRFSNPAADATGKKFGLPLEYNAQEDNDSWRQNLAFFKDIFSN